MKMLEREIPRIQEVAIEGLRKSLERDQRFMADWDKLRKETEHFRNALIDIANMPEHDQDDAHRLRHKATQALKCNYDH